MGVGSLIPIWLTQEEFAALLEYSTSVPTGQVLGKRWKRRIPYIGEPASWVVGEYVPDPAGKPDYIGIRWCRVEIIDPPSPLIKKEI